MAGNKQNQHYARYADPNIFYHEELYELKRLVQVPSRAAEARARIHTIMMNPTMPIIYRAHCHLALCIEEGPHRVLHARNAKKLIEYMLGYGPYYAELHTMMNFAVQMIGTGPIKNGNAHHKDAIDRATIVIDDEELPNGKVAAVQAPPARLTDPKIKPSVEPSLEINVKSTHQPKNSSLKRNSTDLINDDDETEDDAEQSLVTKKPKPAVLPTKKTLHVKFKLPIHPEKPAKPVATKPAKPVKPVKPAKPVTPLRVGDRKSARLSMLANDGRAVKHDKPASTSEVEPIEANTPAQDINAEEKNEEAKSNTETTSSPSSGEWEIVEVRVDADGNEVIVDDDETEDEMPFVEELINKICARDPELVAGTGGIKKDATKVDDVK